MIITPKLIILLIVVVAAAVIDAATINQQQQYSPIVSDIAHHQSIIDKVQHQQQQPIGEFMSENYQRSSANSYDVAPQFFASNNFQPLANDQQMMMMNVDGVNQQSIKNDNRLSSSSSPAAALLKRYDMKKYLLKKILGHSHDLDYDDDHDGDGGFFSQKHLKRHGTAGLAAKILGELIGIKIRESIENFGKSFSEVAKDFTARNFVSLGQLFGRLFQGPQSSSSSSIQSNQNQSSK